MNDDLKMVNEKLDINRTDQIFDSIIHRAKVNDRSAPMNDDELKKVNAVIKAGNLHVNTAKTKVSVFRFIGYRDNQEKIKLAIDRKVRNMRKYGSK